MTLQLNTLYVTSDGAYLSKDHETVVVSVDGKPKVQIPILHLKSVAIFGRALVSPELMAALIEANVYLAYFSPNGRFLARVEGVPGGNVVLRRAQFRTADDEKKTRAIAAAIVAGKLANSRHYLMHARRDASDESRKERIAESCEKLAMLLDQLPRAETLDQIRGIEGAGAKEYFGVFGDLIKRNDDAFCFHGRSRQPPKDRINSLLSFGYALLMQDCSAAAAGVGLDPAVGYLHEDRPGRLSLALDLMEELRAPVVDRLVLALVNRGQVGPDDLKEEASGGWRLTDAGRKSFLVAYQEAKQAEVRHELIEEATRWGRVPHLQALLMARTLRGDLEVYPPFAVR